MPVNAYSRPGTAAAAFSPTGSGCGHRPTVGPHAGHPQSLLLPLLPFATRRCTLPPHTRATCGGWAASAAVGVQRVVLLLPPRPALCSSPYHIAWWFFSFYPTSLPVCPDSPPVSITGRATGTSSALAVGAGLLPYGPSPMARAGHPPVAMRRPVEAADGSVGVASASAMVAPAPAGASRRRHPQLPRRTRLPSRTADSRRLVPHLPVLLAAVVLAALAASASLPAVTAAGGVAAAASDDLSAQSTEQLLALQEDLKGKIAVADETVENLKTSTADLRKQQAQLTDEADQLLGAAEWEKTEYSAREKELADAKADVLAKQAAMTEMLAKVEALKGQIGSLQSTLGVLEKERSATEARYAAPTLANVLDHKAAQWGSVSRGVYNKTMTNIVPAFNSASEQASELRQRINRSSRGGAIAASILVYGFALLSLAGCLRVWKRVRGNLTVARLLFVGDAFCAAFWGVVLVVYVGLGADPLLVLHERTPGLFFVFQLASLCGYVGYVLLRVVVLAAHLTLSALGELLSVIIVGHHFYIRIFTPAVTDAYVHGSAVYYVCYGWLFAAFAYSRIHEWAPLRQVRGEKLGGLTSLRVAWRRFTRSSIPDGEVDPSVQGVDEDLGGGDHNA